MNTLTYHLSRDDEEIELTIEYSVAKYYPAQTYGPPENCYPAEGGEIEDMTVTRDDEPFEITDAERQKIEAFIYDNHDYDDDDYSDHYED